MVQKVEIMEQDLNPVYINNHLTEIAQQFQIYVEDIQPLIVGIEELKEEFPPEILNEVRAMYTHLCRGFMADSDDYVVSNIEKVKRHTKRALLDCYKNSCIVILDRRKFFFDKYKGIDLLLISKGDFLKKELLAYRECANALKKRKKQTALILNR